MSRSPSVSIDAKAALRIIVIGDKSAHDGDAWGRNSMADPSACGESLAP
ncbi:MAG TPA: hypothetical protein PLH31_05760 [Caulobacter sp.]|nr:hypothetical protein [Caulobacter sp.]